MAKEHLLDRSNKNWTPEEIMYLENNFAIKDRKLIARALHRSENAITYKANKLRIYAFTVDGLYLNMLASCLGTHASCVSKWIKEYGLKHKVITKGVKRYVVIRQEDFWGWAKNNKEKIKWAKYKKKTIMPEPEWLESTIKEAQKTKKFYTRITIEEINKTLRLYYEKKMTMEEISIIMKRTPASIHNIIYNKKYCKLVLKQKKENNKFWR